MPLGDVWISSGEIGAYQRTSVDNTAAPESDVLIGDVWIAADDLRQTAQIPNRRAQASKNAMTRSNNERPTGP